MDTLAVQLCASSLPTRTWDFHPLEPAHDGRTKKAIIAIARMLLTALYHMLKNGENYNAELYRKSDLLSVDREITVEQAIIIARKQGYKIKSATA